MLFIYSQHFKSMFPAADDKALELLRSLLQFNPHSRETAANAIQHPYFKNMKRHSYMEHYSTPLTSQNNSASNDDVHFRPNPLNGETEKMCENETNLKFNIIQEILSYRRSDELKGHSNAVRGINGANGR